jgi:putative glutamine amidotransferase
MVNRKPVIGVTRCSRLDDYIASIEQAGGSARILEVAESPKSVLAQIAGVLLTGGADVDPAFYGQERHQSVEDAEPGRDEFEIDLARRALESNVPLLAICRGSQVLNVAAGGTLVQDIPSEITSEVVHSAGTPKDAVAHTVRVADGSALERALGPALGDAGVCAVNSRHHQSVGSVASRLSASAVAPDGVVEGIELPGARFCLGVQWHPENFWRTGEFRSLFEAFVSAARERLDESE